MGGGMYRTTESEHNKIERSIALLNFALDNVHEAAFLTDESARFCYVNEESCRILGYTRDELLRLGVADVAPDFPMERWPGHWGELKTRGSMTFEGRHKAKEGRIFPVEISANYFEYEGKAYNLGLVRDITDRKRAEEERLANLRFFESMDKVNRAIQGAKDLEQMMSDVLDALLSIFECDRAFLLYPCDPEAESWTSPMERTTTEYPGVLTLGLVMPMDPDVAETLRLLLASDGPVQFGPGTGHPLPEDVSKQFGFKSFMSMALYPKVGRPWQFGMHQCSYPHVWTPEEERLFKEIGRRLEDALTSLLAHRDLQESEERYRRIVDTATEGIWLIGPDTTTSFVNTRMAEMLGCSGEEMIGRPFADFMFEEDVPDHLQKMDNRRKGISETYERRFRRKDGQTVWTHASATPIFDAGHHFNGSFGMFTDITERKRVENVLLESEELFRTLTEKSLVGVYIIQDDLFRYVNRALAEMFGSAPEEIIDRLGPVDFLTPEDRERVLDSIRRRTAGEIGFSHHEFHISRKDGSIRAVEAFGSRALHKGRPAVLGTIIDITERKRSEEKLFQVTERWERTFDAVPDLIAIIDTDFRIVHANKAMADRLGSTPAECAGQVCYAAVHKSEALPSFCPHAQTLTDCHEHMAEVSEEGLGGDFIVSTSPIYDSAGQLMGSVHVARDITKRKHAEKKLNEQLHFLQQLLDSIPIPVYYKDVDGLYLGCNSAFERFIGLSRKDVVGKTVYEVAPKERADKHHEADSALLRQPGVQIYEASGIYNNGECHNVIFNKATFVDANNRVAGTVGAMIDITSLRKAEEERKKLETQLHQAQKMEAIGQLAGGIAHDFNNILTAIMGYSSIINLRMEKESPLRHFVEQVLASGERAAELTNGLLAFSRRQVLHAKPMDLCGVVRGLEKMLGRLVPEDIAFKTTVAEGDLIVMADKGQIEQVLMNLVTNAKDAMPRGGTLTIEVSSAVMEDRFVHADGFGEPGHYACVTVADTGQGMDEETRKRIFEPFFTTKEAGKGTGLGMAIIYGIIQQHKGYISVYSEKGMGTTFKIYLPLIAEGIEEVYDTREAEPPPGGTETVLLAEDDAAVLELHRMILEEAGYRVIEAVDGRDALDKFTEHRTEVDILATDVIMPKMNGKSLYEEMRKIRPDMKVLFISGYTKDIIVERGILEDEFSVITKPVTPHELLKKIREILD
jgi:PAS domain S-box-containing protein